MTEPSYRDLLKQSKTLGSQKTLRVQDKLKSDFTVKTLAFILNRYSRVLHMLYKQYFSKPIEPPAHGFCTLFTEQGALPVLLSLEELSNVVSLKAKKKLKQLQYSDFTTVLIYLAIYIFSKPPREFSPAIALRALVEHFRDFGSNVPLALYEEPGLGNTDILSQLNARLAKDPRSELPAGYTRVGEKSLAITYELPSVSAQSESEVVSLSVLDGIVHSTFGFHILSPKFGYTQTYRAKEVARPFQDNLSYYVDPTLSRSMKSHIHSLSK